MRVEKTHEESRNSAYKAIEDDNLAAAANLDRLLKIKAQGIEFKTKVDFDNSVYLLISDAEKVLSERKQLLESTNAAQDDLKIISKFMSNMEMGRHNWVGYSISSGYKSIDFQQPETGDTALHLAVKNGKTCSLEHFSRILTNILSPIY